MLFAAGAQAADWPTYRADAARSGYTPERLPEALSPLWTYRGVHPPMPAWPTRTRQRFDVAYQPVIAGGTLYFGSSADGKLYALEAATGRARWEFLTGGPVRFAPVVWQDRLLAASDDGWLYCLGAAEGKLLWKLRAGPTDDMLLGNDRMISRWPARGGPVVADGVVYFGAGIWPTEGILILAVNPATGEVLWRNDSSGSIYMPQPHPTAEARSGAAVQGYLAVHGDALFVPTGRAVPAVFNRADGKFRYFRLQENHHQGGADVVAIDDHFFNSGLTFAAADGAIQSRLGLQVAAHPDAIICSGKNTIFALDRGKFQVDKEIIDRKGKKKTVKVPTPAVWTAALAPDADPPTAPKETETPPNTMSSTAWSTPAVSDEASAMIVAGDKVVVGGRGKVSLVDIRRRDTVWTTPVSGAACGLAVADGRLYVSTDRGLIYCFGAGGKAGPISVGPAPQSPQGAENAACALAAEEIVRRTGVTKGYCLDLACGDGCLALELAKRTQLQIYAVERDTAKVQAARQMLDAAGLYGVRVTVHQADPAQAPYPNHFADLVVSGRSVTEGPDAAPRQAIERMQSPFGGIACLGKPGAMQQWVRGPLEGAGNWTHQNTNAANTLCSEDVLLRSPLEMLWFRDTDLVMSNRHGRGPAPLVAGGRMFSEGINAIRAVNIYNGRTLWEFPLEGVLSSYHREHSIGAAWTGSNMCVGGDRVYVHTGDRCVCLDAATGRQVADLRPPAQPDGKPGTWGYIACQDGTLFGSLVNEQYLVKCSSPRWDTSGQFTESLLFFALDAQSGKLKWTYTPEHSVRHNAIAVGDGRVYLIDRPLAPADDIRFDLADAQAQAKRRAADGSKDQAQELRRLSEHQPGKLLALDAQTGKILWKTDQDVFGTMLALSREHGVLLMSYQPAHQASRESELGDRMAGIRARDGVRLWDVKADYAARPILNDRTIYAEPGAWDLLTGQRLPFTLTRSYGCGIPVGSKRMLVFRSATLGYLDLAGGGRTENYGGIRPGCWINAIPAGGLLLMADAASWCTCSYLNQATIALQPAEANSRPKTGSVQTGSAQTGSRTLQEGS